MAISGRVPTANTVWDNKIYAATFDIPKTVFPDLIKALHKDVRLEFAKWLRTAHEGLSTFEFDQQTDIGLVQAHIGELTKSASNGETFAPLIIDRISSPQSQKNDKPETGVAEGSLREMKGSLMDQFLYWLRDPFGRNPDTIIQYIYDDFGKKYHSLLQRCVDKPETALLFLATMVMVTQCTMFFIANIMKGPPLRIAEFAREILTKVTIILSTEIAVVTNNSIRIEQTQELFTREMDDTRMSYWEYLERSGVLPGDGLGKIVDALLKKANVELVDIKEREALIDKLSEYLGVLMKKVAT